MLPTRGFIPSLLLSLSAGTAALASPYDYPASSMAHYNEVSSQRAFNSYMASGAHTYYPDQHRPSFSPPAQPSRYDAPPAPQSGWSNYWQGYRAPVSNYAPPAPVDRRTPQQVLIDAAKAGNTIAMWNLAHNYIEGNNGFAENSDAGIFWLKTAFEHGKVDAGTRLFYYFDPKFFAGKSAIKKDAIQSLYWLQKSAKAGDREAMTVLGGRTLQGAGVDVDAVEGVRLLKAAFQAGDQSAAITLKAAYEWGWGVKVDLNEAIRWQREKVRLGMSRDAPIELIRLLVESEDSAQRTHLPEIQALIASRIQDADMQLVRAKLTDDGVLGAPDPVACIAQCRKILAVTGNARGDKYTIRDTEYLLAAHLFEGNGVKKDDLAAYQLYLDAATAEMSWDPPSSRTNFYFATLLSGHVTIRRADGTATLIDEPEQALPRLFSAENSEDLPAPLRAQAALLAARNLTKHPEIAGKFPERSVDEQIDLAQHLDPDTAVGIAFGRRSGWFGWPNKGESRERVRKAAANGNQSAAYWFVRWTCEDSDGHDYWEEELEPLLVNKNWAAFAWVGELLLSGKFLEKDVARAETLLRSAATEGDNRDAQNELGLALCSGAFGPKKTNEGVEWLEKSLRHGLWSAGATLAKIYHQGLDVEKNETRAQAALEKAGELGGPEAAAVAADAYEKGDIIAADANAAARWRSKSVD